MVALESPEVQRANRRFIKASMRAPLLSREHEFDLARRWRDQDDVAALHELISAYARLVVSAASYYRKYGLAMGDLIQEGLVGLMMAAARFDPGREARFSTYASWWVRSAMQGFILRNWSVVRTGTTAAQKALFFNLRRLRARIDGDPGAPLTPESRQHIAHELRVGVADVEAMEGRLAASDQSLNVQVSEGSDDEWQDLLVDPGPSPEEIVAGMCDAETRGRWLTVALAELGTRERQIVAERRLRDEPITLEKLGQRFGISKERVRQIEHNALKKIRRSIFRQSGTSVADDLNGI
ncbi:MAG: RNA polymerase factor sigma-32 [Alphaproteobacteria bacterium]